MSLRRIWSWWPAAVALGLLVAGCGDQPSDHETAEVRSPSAEATQEAVIPPTRAGGPPASTAAVESETYEAYALSCDQLDAVSYRALLAPETRRSPSSVYRVTAADEGWSWLVARFADESVGSWVLRARAETTDVYAADGVARGATPDARDATSSSVPDRMLTLRDDALSCLDDSEIDEGLVPTDLPPGVD